MTDAPERIWADPDHWIEGPPSSDLSAQGYTEYVRADLVEAAVRRALEAAAVVCEAIRHRQIIGPMPERACFDQEQFIRAIASDPEAVRRIVEGDG
jgi:hypothetical protein